MKIVAIVQARLNSKRLPKKVIADLCGEPLLVMLLNRLKKSKNVHQLIAAVPVEDLELINLLEESGFGVYKGSSNNVLDRYYGAAEFSEADVVIRITGDCPLVDYELVDEMVERFLALNVDYLSNTINPTYPDGMDVEIFTFDTLKKAKESAIDEYDLEHVTPYIKNIKNNFQIESFELSQDFSELRWTVDEASDLTVIRSVFMHFYPNILFSWRDVLNLESEKPQLFSLNRHISRNEGARMGSGQKLWRRAKQVIPGGNMLLSKRPEMFLPDNWPSYYSKAKGCTVWDLDGRNYIDMSIMGIGTNTLGYGNEEVDDAVIDAVQKGNMSTLNCPEEVYLAEKLIEMHPWADMVRFARSGGEANSIAIRIARAATGKDGIAICGYHGWHDWYLSANLNNNETLAGHLLPGLSPLGVPKSLVGLVHPFTYNNFQQLEEIIRDKDIGVIKMEVMRNYEPKDNFLSRVRELATKKGIVLIFDECTSGFRESYGGLHLKYGVNPDMAMFGKALGNGYAVTAVIGTSEVMQAAQSTFISSTFWTERIGSVAGLATLQVMQRVKSWEKITSIGNSIISGWQSLSQKYDLKLEYFGLPALAGFNIVSPNSLGYKTLISQMMLENGILASNSVYACTSHTPEIVKNYLEVLEHIFIAIKKCQEGDDINRLLKGPVCHSTFKRLN